MKETELYDILGLEPTVTDDDIKHREDLPGLFIQKIHLPEVDVCIVQFRIFYGQCDGFFTDINSGNKRSR